MRSRHDEPKLQPDGQEGSTHEPARPALDDEGTGRRRASQHLRYDEDAGQALGDQVGDFVSDHILEPVRDRR